jgi:RHS repeat-associated protein
MRLLASRLRRSSWSCFVCAAALALSLLAIVGSAGALGASPSAALSASAVPTPMASPTVVRELTGLRTATSSTFLQSDGSRRLRVYAAPIHYKDAAGAWRDIDPSLVVGPGGTYRAASTPFDLSLGSATTGAPARLTYGGYSLTMSLPDLVQTAPLVAGETASYLAPGSAASVSYRAYAQGVEQTITLTSAGAPSTYGCRLDHPGLTLRRDASGSWGFFRPAGREPLLLLSDIEVFDASRDEAGQPAFCGAARMVVAAGEDASTLTYVVPRTWLDDPARVYPVQIDPTVYLNPQAGNQPSYCDTWIESARPTGSHGPSEFLATGKHATYGYTRSLVSFNVAGQVPAGSFVTASTLWVRKYASGGSNAATSVATLNQGWTGGSSWSSLGCSVNSFPSSLCTYLGQQTVAPQNWLQMDATSRVQAWVDGSQANYGFLLYQKEDGSQGTGYFSQWRSADYSSSWAPELDITYITPQATISFDKSTYRIGEQATLTATVSGVGTYAYLKDVQLRINGTKASGSWRGQLGWFVSANPGPSWVTGSDAQSFYAYEAPPGTAYGTQYIAPDLTAAADAGGGDEGDPLTLTIPFTLKDTFGDLQANDVAVKFGFNRDIYASSSNWSTPWQQETSPTFGVLPKPLTALSATLSASDWFTSSGNDDVNGQGRGSVALSWPADPAATGYKILLWDGYQYDQVATTTQTSWTTSGKGLYPSDTQIAAIPQNSQANPFKLDGSGLDLRDNPNALYQRMGGTATSKTETAYRFCVVPYNAAGSLTQGENTVLALTLDNRSLSASEDPQHTSVGLGDWDDHALTARLDDGSVLCDVTDLAIASHGPAAALSRSYSSQATAAGLFAPGWFFGFQQNLVVQSTTITYTDAERQAHVFTGSGSSWTAPRGFLATLTPSGSNWRLTFPDQSYLTFDSSGKFLSETDHNSNAVTYAWSSGQMTTITAANGQQITLSYSSGRLANASYATADGTRTVTYTTSSPWQATLYPGTAVEKRVAYGYDATPRLTSITQENWPQSGQSALEQLVYNANGKLTELDYPDMFATTSGHPVVRSDAKATISYDSATQATVRRYGTVADVASQIKGQQVYAWDAHTGLCSSCVSGSSQPLTTSYSYAFDRQLAGAVTSAGQKSFDSYDTAGNCITSTAPSATLTSANQVTARTYDAAHRLLTETGWQGPTLQGTTSYAYNAAGDLTEEQQKLDGATWLSDTQRSYDAAGRMTMEKVLLSGTPSAGTWQQTDSSNFAPCGAERTSIAKAVKLSPGAAAGDLTQTATYDAFGNLLTQKDWSNSRVTETNTYDIAGNQLTQVDAAGLATHTIYDRLGNAVESYRAAPGTQMKASWIVTGYDPMGRATSVTTRLSDANGSPTTQSVVTTVFDGIGDQLISSDSTLAGQPEKWLYDDAGNVTSHWALGVADYSLGRATRSSYDAQGQVTSETAAGQSSSATTSYDASGNVSKQTEADGSWTSTSYDGVGNATSQTTPLTGYDPQSNAAATTTSTGAYDLANRQRAAVEDPHSAIGLKTSYATDLAGRQTVAAGHGAPQTQTQYNTLDQVLQTVDADGVTDSRTHDTHGVVTSETIGTKTTGSTYDAVGRLLTQTDNDGNVLTNTYDAFGNLTRELHQSSGGVTLKDVHTGYDSLGRPTSQSDWVGGRTHSWTYPVNTPGGVQETVGYDSAPLTSVQLSQSSRGLETQQAATIAAGTTITRTIDARDAGDRWTQATLAGSPATIRSRSFDAAGRLVRQWGAGLAAGASGSDAYLFDPDTGRKTADNLQLSYGGVISSLYAYYPDGRLASATTNGVAAGYAYDSFGNLARDVTGGVTTTFDYQDGNQLFMTARGATETYFGWDSLNAWRTSQGPSSDPDQITYAYNAQGRMTSYANAATSNSATYSYDAQGQRRAKTVSTNGGWDWLTTSFTYDGQTLLGLRRDLGDGDFAGVDYLYDEEGAAWGGVYRSSSGGSLTTVYFSIVTDDRGDVVELLDRSGSPFCAYRYDPWGLPQGSGSHATGVWTQGTSLLSAATASAVADLQVLRYAGYVHDAESGLYYCNARYYDPATRQWTTADPAKADGEESAYQYCGGDPVGRVDPSGRYSREYWYDMLWDRMVMEFNYRAVVGRLLVKTSGTCASTFLAANMNNVISSVVQRRQSTLPSLPRSVGQRMRALACWKTYVADDTRRMYYIVCTDIVVFSKKGTVGKRSIIKSHCYYEAYVWGVLAEKFLKLYQGYL